MCCSLPLCLQDGAGLSPVGIPEYNSCRVPSTLALSSSLHNTEPSDNGDKRGSHRWPMPCPFGLESHAARSPGPKAPPPPSGSSLRRPPGLWGGLGDFPGSLGQAWGPLRQQRCRPDPQAGFQGPGGPPAPLEGQLRASTPSARRWLCSASCCSSRFCWAMCALLLRPGGQQGSLPPLRVQQPPLKLRGFGPQRPPRGRRHCRGRWGGLDGPQDRGRWRHRGRWGGRGDRGEGSSEVRGFGLRQARPIHRSQGQHSSRGPRLQHQLPEGDSRHEPVGARPGPRQGGARPRPVQALHTG